MCLNALLVDLDTVLFVKTKIVSALFSLSLSLSLSVFRLEYNRPILRVLMRLYVCVCIVTRGTVGYLCSCAIDIYINEYRTKLRARVLILCCMCHTEYTFSLLPLCFVSP